MDLREDVRLALREALPDLCEPLLDLVMRYAELTLWLYQPWKGTCSLSAWHVGRDGEPVIHAAPPRVPCELHHSACGWYCGYTPRCLDHRGWDLFRSGREVRYATSPHHDVQAVLCEGELTIRSTLPSNAVLARWRENFFGRIRRLVNRHGYSYMCMLFHGWLLFVIKVSRGLADVRVFDVRYATTKATRRAHTGAYRSRLYFDGSARVWVE